MKRRTATHVDPATMPAAGVNTKTPHAQGRACTKPPEHFVASPSRRKVTTPPVRDHLGATLMRPTAASAARQVNAAGADDGVGTVTKPRALMRRAPADSPGFRDHLKGAGLSVLSPRSPRVPRFTRTRGAITDDNRVKKLMARGLVESPAPKRAPANKPRSAPPFAVDVPPPAPVSKAGVRVPAVYEPKRSRRHVDPTEVQASGVPDGVTLHKSSRRRFCKPQTPRLKLSAAMSSARGKRSAASRINGVPPGGAEHGNVISPAPLPNATSGTFDNQRHVATGARVDHEALPFGRIAHNAQATRRFNRRRTSVDNTNDGAAAAAPASQPRGVRRVSVSNPTLRTMAVGAQNASAVTASCPFDVSYTRSPFAPPTARGTRNGRKLSGVPAKPSQRPF